MAAEPPTARRALICVVFAVIATCVIFAFGPFERYHAADIKRIRAAHRLILSACDQKEERVADAVSVVTAYTRRVPDLDLPLGGGGLVMSMRELAREEGAFLESLPARRDLHPSGRACVYFGPLLGAQLQAVARFSRK